MSDKKTLVLAGAALFGIYALSKKTASAVHQQQPAPSTNNAVPVPTMNVGNEQTNTVTTQQTAINPIVNIPTTTAPVYHPSLSWSLVNEPIYYYNYGVKYDAQGQPYSVQVPNLSSYNWYIVLSAKGFPGNTPVIFTIDEHSYNKFAGYGALYPPTVTLTTDAQGNATFKQKVYSGISQPASDYFQVGGFVTATDGTNTAGPVQFHYLYR